jgi:PilZ domain
MLQKPSYSRRALTRLCSLEDIWVCWRCDGRDDISRVLDISIDGMFIETGLSGLKQGMPAKLDFLVQEGRIKAEAVVRHVKSGSGLGLRFLVVAGEDRQRLKALLSRLRSRPSRSEPQLFRAL